MKKQIFLLRRLVILLIILSSVTAYSQEPSNSIPQKIRLKFKTDSPQFYTWSYSDRMAEITELVPLLGEHTAKPYIDNHLLQAVKNMRYKNYPSLANSHSPMPIEAICEIEYISLISPIIAAKKISTFSFVEYAEPIYERHFVEMPNDTMLGDQYYLKSVEAFAAWDLMNERGISDSILIGIVDTGVDTTHPDLQKNLYKNQGEMGIDENDMDKSKNGIDDDNNGYIDDWFGWDFVSGPDGQEQDNIPLPGHSHGTHCTGICAAVHNNIAGIAGTAFNAKYLPIKIGYDRSSSTSTANGYQGILYGATMGCKVLNCSWGGGGFSQAEQEIITLATQLGSLVVSAAGNDGENTSFYPAAYAGVISVAASDSSDKIAYFSNYGYSVDVVAPGYQILSTVAGDIYGAWNGTSMASPVAASVAAMIRLSNPELSPIQAGEVLKSNCDNIDLLNDARYSGKIGMGRVNAYKALSDENPQSLIVQNIRVTDRDGDELFNGGDTLDIVFDIKNVLKAINGVKVYISDESVFPIKYEFLNNMLLIGDIEENSLVCDVGPISVVVPDAIMHDQKADVSINLFNYDSTGNDLSYSTGCSFTLYPTYMTLRNNKLTTTINSQGNIGYNDYPNNEQGYGFLDPKGNSLLFEGALMIALDTASVSNVARSGQSGNSASQDFIYIDLVEKASQDNETSVYCKYSDVLMGIITSEIPGFDIEQTVIQKSTAEGNSPLDETIFIEYDFINRTSKTSSLYAGLYFDWDMGVSSSDDQIIYEHDYNYGYGVSYSDDSTSLVGVKLLSNQQINFYAMNNAGMSADDIGVYDGFSEKEKYLTLSQGIAKDSSKVGDASMIIGAGPLSLDEADTVKIVFAIFTADTKAKLDQSANFLDDYKQSLNLNGNLTQNIIDEIYPNPVSKNGSITVNYRLADECEVVFTIYDLAGKQVAKYKYDHQYFGKHFAELNLPSLAKGSYYLSCQFGDEKRIKKFIVMD